MRWFLLPVGTDRGAWTGWKQIVYNVLNQDSYSHLFFYIKKGEFWEMRMSIWYCCVHSLCYTLSLLHTILQEVIQIVMNDPSADTRPERCIALSVTVTTHLLFMPAVRLQLLWPQELITNRWQAIDLSSENSLNFISAIIRIPGYSVRSRLHGKRLL